MNSKDSEINAGRARARLEIDEANSKLREDTNRLYSDIVQRLVRIETKVESLK